MQKFSNLIVLSPLIYLVHHFEEHIIFNFREWRLSYFLDNNPLTSEEMLLRLAAFLLIIIFVHQIKQNRASALLVLYFVMTTQVVNAFFHVFFSFYFGNMQFFILLIEQIIHLIFFIDKVSHNFKRCYPKKGKH